MRKEKWLNRNLALLLTGRMVSDIGSSIQMVVMPLYILDIGGTAKTIGLYSFLYLLPILLMYPLGGVIGDRLDRKKIMVSADLLSGIVILILAYLSQTNQLSITILLVIQIMVSIFFGFFDPASKGVLPQIVKKDYLEKANSSIAAFRIIAAILAPLIGVWLYIRFGITFLFVFNGISFLLSALSETFISYNHTKRTTDVNVSGIFKDLRMGFDFIKKQKDILNLCLFFMMVFMLINPIFTVVLPFFFRSSLNYPDTHYGYLQAALFIGALFGSISVGFLINEKDSRVPLIYGIGVLLVALIAFSTLLFPSVISFIGNDTLLYISLLVITMFLMYGSLMSINIPLQTIIQRSTPEEYISRVFSIVSMITKGGAPLGALIYGLVIERASIHKSIMAATVIIVVVSLIFIKSLMKNVT
jgi:MFS family permease